MTTKNKNDNDLVLYFIWVFGIILTFASLFGILIFMAFGVATSLILSLLVICVFVGILLFLFSSLVSWASLPFPKEKVVSKHAKKRIDKIKALDLLSFTLVLVSLFGLILALHFGVAFISPLVWGLFLFIVVGLSVGIVSILMDLITITEYQPQKKKVIKNDTP